MQRSAATQMHTKDCHHSNRCQLHNNRANGWQRHAINQLGDKETLITQMNAKETASTEILVKVRASLGSFLQEVAIIQMDNKDTVSDADGSNT